MAHDGKTQRDGAQRTSGLFAVEGMPSAQGTDAVSGKPEPPSLAKSAPPPSKRPKEAEPDPARRAAKRRPAGPPRARIAANDDVPSIGGLIFALQQKPSNQPFLLAAAGSGAWLAVGALLAWAMLASEMAAATSYASVFTSPMMIVVAATICLPIALFWFLALLAWRAQELKLMSSAMTEVAVRLAEPDRGAEQSAASLGQAVRRQVSFMNEAISRALGRAGELEALVHNEVATLEKSYSENEHKIKGLIQELVGERHALVSTTDKVAETLKAMGSEVPSLIEKLSGQQIKLAKIIEGAGQNLIALENQLATASGSLETALANRTQQLQAVLDDYTVALDATLASRAEALDMALVERTRALDAAFSERLALFDQSMLRSTAAIDHAVSDKARALTVAMESHVRSLSDTLGRQSVDLDQSMMHRLDAVRRTSDSITRRSLDAIEGLSSRADLLKNVSENLLLQLSGAANRSDQDLLPDLAEHSDHTLRGYAESRARQLVQQLTHGNGAQAQAAVAEVERLRSQTDPQSRAIVAEFERLRAHFDLHGSRSIEDMRARGPASADSMPGAVRENAEVMRVALQDQLRALEQLSSLSGRDVSSPAAPAGGALSLTAAYAAQASRTQSGPAAAPAPGSADNSDRWSLTDLLARASRDDDGTTRAPIINVDNIARALDPTTAAAIWSRFRAGQRGIMVRSIYTNEGRTAFDDVSERYKSDVDFHRTVDRYLTDFEHLLRNLEQKDPSGRTLHNHLVSDSGRVYLFLAHASGRLR